MEDDFLKAIGAPSERFDPVTPRDAAAAVSQLVAGTELYKSFMAEMERTVVRPAADINRIIEQSVQSFTTYVNATLEKFAASVQPLLDWARLEKELAVRLAERGWLMLPLFDLSVLREIQSALDEKPEDVDALLTAHYRSQVATLVAEICDFACCAPWLSKIESAFSAHEAGRYDLAVPVWLIIMEGVTRAIAKVQGFKLYTEVHTAERYGKRIRPLFGSNGPPDMRGGDSLRVSLIKVLHHLSRSAKHRVPGVGVNRNAILHGLDPDFGIERESLQCINTLLFVCVLSEGTSL